MSCMGSSCASVGRAVTSDISGLRFESSHLQALKKPHDLFPPCIISTFISRDKADNLNVTHTPINRES